MRSNRQIAFLCDPNLGRLAKWLRIMGFDTQYMPSWDEDLIRQARRAERFVLTRRRAYAGRPGVLVIQPDKVMDQLRALAAAIDLKDGMRPYERCAVCNGQLADIDRSEARGRVPEYVYQTHVRFVRCPECRKIYWEGTHRERVAEVLKSVLG